MFVLIPNFWATLELASDELPKLFLSYLFEEEEVFRIATQGERQGPQKRSHFS